VAVEWPSFSRRARVIVSGSRPLESFPQTNWINPHQRTQLQPSRSFQAAPRPRPHPRLPLRPEFILQLVTTLLNTVNIILRPLLGPVQPPSPFPSASLRRSSSRSDVAPPPRRGQHTTTTFCSSSRYSPLPSVIHPLSRQGSIDSPGECLPLLLSPYRRH
jgi:hypothetical protein